MKFKVGDRVKLMTERHGICVYDPYCPKYGVVRRILRTENSLPHYEVLWDNDRWNYYYRESLELVDDPIIDVDELFEEIDI